MAHYSSGLSLLRTSPHDPTFQGSSPGISVQNAWANHSINIQHSALQSFRFLNIFGTNFIVPFWWTGKKFHWFSSMLSAIKGRPKPSKTPAVKSGCELALVSIQSQVIHGGLAFLRPLKPQEDQLWQLIRPQRSLLLPISQTCPPARIRPAN